MKTAPILSYALVVCLSAIATARAEQTGGTAVAQRFTQSTTEITSPQDKTSPQTSTPTVQISPAFDTETATNPLLHTSPTRTLSSSIAIHDIGLQLLSDEDRDGYFSAFRLRFTATSFAGTLPAFARLYLRRGMGPWNHFYTTDTFMLRDSFPIDEVVVTSDLLDGYDPGIYDMLLVIYTEPCCGSGYGFGPGQFGELAQLPLEDQTRDAVAYYDYPAGETVIIAGTSTGAINTPLLAMFLLPVVRRWLSRRRDNLATPSSHGVR